VTFATRRADLIVSLRALDDGTGDIGVIVDHALADDPEVTAAAVREIVLEARAEASTEAHALPISDDEDEDEELHPAGKGAESPRGVTTSWPTHPPNTLGGICPLCNGGR